MIKCEGICGVHNECKGIVRTVYVEAGNFSGAYNYCDTAVEIDEKAGLQVTDYWHEKKEVAE